jgi:hypothetical protein
MTPRPIRLPDALYNALQREALNDDRTLSAMVRKLLVEALGARGVIVHDDTRPKARP